MVVYKNIFILAVVAVVCNLKLLILFQLLNQAKVKSLLQCW
jgi:hypothetical protein